MAVCMLMECALDEDINNAGGSTTSCRQNMQIVVSSVRRGRGRWWLVDLDSQRWL